MKKRVLVAGATGYLGEFVAKESCRSGSNDWRCTGQHIGLSALFELI